MPANQPPESFVRTLDVDGRTYRYVSIEGVPGAERLPVCLKILLENVIRRAPR